MKRRFLDYRVYNSICQGTHKITLYYLCKVVVFVRYNERIREIREDNFLTQQKVADLLHIGQRPKNRIPQKVNRPFV